MRRLLLIIYMYVAWAAGYSFAEVPFVVFTPIDATHGLSGNQVRNIAQLPDGRMLITTVGQFNLYDGTGFTYLHYGQEHICKLAAYKGFHHVYIDGRGYVWMKNWGILMAIDITKEQVVAHPDSLLKQWGIGEALNDFFLDEAKNYWIVTASDELVCIDNNDLHAACVLPRVSSLSGQKDDSIYDLVVSGGKLYLFYQSGFLSCYDLVSKTELYRKWLGNFLSEERYGRTSYVVTVEDGFYQLCNGSQGGVLLYFDYASSEWTEVFRSSSSWVNYISLDHKGNIWLSGRDGLWYISSDLRRKEFIPVLKLVDGRKIETEVSTLYYDNRGGLWLGTLDRGLLYYHPDRFRFRNIGRTLFPVSGDKTLQVTGFRETDECKVLVETSEGVFEYAPDDAFSPLKKTGMPLLHRRSLVSDSLPVSSLHPCNDVLVDSQKNVWIAQEDGLMRWNPRTGSRRMFYTTDGLGNNVIRSIIETSDSTFWIATANGLSYLTVHAGRNRTDSCSFANFNQLDGVIEGEFCPRSVFQASDGTIYWGGINGFNSLSPSRRVSGQAPFVPLFVGLNLFGMRIEPGRAYDGRVILQRPLSQTQEVVLEHDQNFFSLEFSALNYINPTQTYYRYCLEGLDEKEWQIRSSDGRGYVTYTDVPPGTYCFRVCATRNGENWQACYAKLQITVKPPFWQTPWAYLLYVLVALGVVVSSLTGYLHHKKRSIVREQKEKLDEMKGVFLQNINQELQAPVEKMLPSLDEALRWVDDGSTKRRLQGIRQETLGLKNLIGQLAEGVLLPLPADEKTLDLDALLMDMRRLLEQQEERKRQAKESVLPDSEYPLLSESEEAFIRKALHYVEQNLTNPAYSVEAWSRDLCMDRTGLYRKLVTIVGKTPTNFIRSVRLKQAAHLLEKGYTVAEVADMVGFSTSSYLSKCFQEEYGVRPSQYANRKGKQ